MCMYDYHIAVVIKQLASFVCVLVCIYTWGRARVRYSNNDANNWSV